VRRRCRPAAHAGIPEKVGLDLETIVANPIGPRGFTGVTSTPASSTTPGRSSSARDLVRRGALPVTFGSVSIVFPTGIGL
jgi:hypothetical protein